jgi:signal transduction histidine kinase
MFAPLKERLQRLINRLMKGRHDDPYAVLVELGNQLVQPLEPLDTLNAVARTIKEALLLPYAAISVGRNGQETLLASAGETAGEPVSFPVIHSGEQLGTLFVANRSPGEIFSPEDIQFLEVLLHQAGPIVHNVHMTLGMKLLAQDLQESRGKLVLAREEERRQIRRNLHDDLAPRLAALALNAAAAEKYVVKAPDTAIEMLSDLRKVIRSTIDDIRTLVHDLRPPTLDELGLAGAIRERIAELTKAARLESGHEGILQIRLLSPESLPSLPAAVEVAAYRIITESLVNVVRHAKATVCTIRLDLSVAGQLTVEITDNGTGLHSQAAPNGKGGIGLSSIRERAAELGGQCLIERLEQGGTCVKAVLPL